MSTPLVSVPDWVVELAQSPYTEKSLAIVRCAYAKPGGWIATMGLCAVAFLGERRARRGDYVPIFNEATTIMDAALKVLLAGARLGCSLFRKCSHPRKEETQLHIPESNREGDQATQATQATQAKPEANAGDKESQLVIANKELENPGNNLAQECVATGYKTADAGEHDSRASSELDEDDASIPDEEITHTRPGSPRLTRFLSSPWAYITKEEAAQ
eukprot:CAMPEP_0184527134 /NCGR_PEP_ID=MMETSP0198_2-20121128/11033_1 /TAXON_ID=1112570 /ORGANISM="Thraustochytrium sp., Strain LLF1b" /LENGTH=215 /DNA_ID=CAMNT_0026918767 /DNA_START=294 /DNA_END=941 /DNA_ORIENTATION=-